VRLTSVFGRLLGADNTVIEKICFDEQAGIVVAHVRPRARVGQRCGRCGARGPRFDRGEGRRRWRALDLGAVQAFVEADAPRVNCVRHGPTVIAVPWARHGAGHTRSFDDTVAWLAVRTSKTAVGQLMRIAWRTVGAIVARVSDDALAAAGDRLAGLTRIGIDELSYKKGHRYITCVVDHDTGRLVWAAPGRDMATLHAFFDLLGPERCQQVTHVSADAADWIAHVVTQRCPAAVQAMDPFHTVAWATEALDQVRRDVWNNSRGGKGRATARSKGIKNLRWVLWRNPEDLSEAQAAKLAWVERTHPGLHRAWALKEGLRWVFHLSRQGFPRLAITALDRWLSWARRSQIPAFVDLARRIRKHRTRIEASLQHRLSNALLESVNTKLRLLTRQAFGFHNPHALIGLAMLALGGLCPPLPDR
jgi:transposase